VKFLCEQCKAKYQIADEKAAGKTVRMKCRKCGHLIEVRGVALGGEAPATERMSGAPPQRPGGTRPTATSFAAARTAEKPGGALAGALKSALQREDEISAPVDMSDLSPSDEWYVAINGVPVGPIRIAEVRRKAAIGAVTEESLCWQEGLEEWRPLRSFPDLAAIVRDAFSSNRSSMTPPPPEPRAASVVPPQARASARPAAVPPRAPPARPAAASQAAPMARSNVVPITSRLATAERLSEEPVLAPPVIEPPIAPPQPIRPSVVPDPFAAPARPSPASPAAVHPVASPPARFEAAPIPAPAVTASPSVAPVPQELVGPTRKGPPWMAIAMVAAAVAFGVTVGLAFAIRPPPAAPSVVVQVPAIATAAAGPAIPTATAAAIATSDPVQPVTSASSATPRVGVAATAKPTSASASTSAPSASASAAAPAHGPLDLGGLRTGAVAPTDDPGSGSEAPHAAGQCITGSQVQQVIGLHRVGLQRSCWERSASQKPSANVTVSLTIGADGTAQGVSASGDDMTVAKCIESDVRGWHFPAMGCSQPTSIPFHFVRQ
jgi:predicted Zn finger-like uncharacterized protein